MSGILFIRLSNPSTEGFPSLAVWTTAGPTAACGRIVSPADDFRGPVERFDFFGPDRPLQNHLVGFYTLTATSVALDALAPELVKKLPRYPVVPAALLGRLAGATRSQGKGLGAALLADALLRTARVEMGVFAMLVDAKDEAAQRFYEKHGFTLLTSGEQRRLVLPIATALRAMDGKGVK